MQVLMTCWQDHDHVALEKDFAFWVCSNTTIFYEDSSIQQNEWLVLISCVSKHLRIFRQNLHVGL